MNVDAKRLIHSVPLLLLGFALTLFLVYLIFNNDDDFDDSGDEGDDFNDEFDDE